MWAAIKRVLAGIKLVAVCALIALLILIWLLFTIKFKKENEDD